MAGGGHLATNPDDPMPDSTGKATANFFIHLKAIRASLDRHVADHKTTPTCYNKSVA
jgi:hypothetical protein